MIESADITAVEHQVYDFFLEDAVDQEEPAQFVFNQVADGVENNISVEDTRKT